MNLELPDEEFFARYGCVKEDAAEIIAGTIEGLAKKLKEVLEWQRSHHQPALDCKGTTVKE